MAGKQNLERRKWMFFGGALALTSLTTPMSLANGLLTYEVLPSCAANFDHTDHLCLRDFDFRDFRLLQGQDFLLGSDKHQIRMKLINATSHARAIDPRPATVRREPFSLHFTAAKELNLHADIYELQHPKLGSMKVFLSQIGQAGSEQSHFEVVFG